MPRALDINNGVGHWNAPRAPRFREHVAQDIQLAIDGRAGHARRDAATHPSGHVIRLELRGIGGRDRIALKGLKARRLDCGASLSRRTSSR